MKFIRNRDIKNPVVPGHRRMQELVKSSKNYKVGAKILDVGCWTGAMESLFYNDKVALTGIDIMGEPLVVVRSKFPRFKFYKASVVDRLPFVSGSFDIAMYFMVLEHVPRGFEVHTLLNLHRVLKNGGSLFLSTMHFNLRSILSDPAYWLGHRHYSEVELRAMLEYSGFEVKEIVYNGGYFTTLHIWLLYFFKHVLRRGEPRGKFLDYLMKLDYRDKGFVEIDIHAVKIKRK